MNSPDAPSMRHFTDRAVRIARLATAARECGAFATMEGDEGEARACARQLARARRDFGALIAGAPVEYREDLTTMRSISRL